MSEFLVNGDERVNISGGTTTNSSDAIIRTNCGSARLRKRSFLRYNPINLPAARQKLPFHEQGIFFLFREPSQGHEKTGDNLLKH
jgi:hypothetical protein